MPVAPPRRLQPYVANQRGGRQVVRAETRYLVFAGVAPDFTPTTPEEAAEGIASAVKRKIGPVSRAPDRRLGFMILLNPWNQPQVELERWLDAVFAAARAHDIAVHIALETHYFWQNRSDLYSDPANVEWTDWNGTPHPARYLDWGAPERLAPHMCYESPAIVAEVSRIGTQVIGAALRRHLDTLVAEGRADLFSGVTVTSEPSLDDYTALDPKSALAQLMDAEGAPRAQLGRSALSRMGYSASTPPPDMDAALAEVNRRWVERWSCALLESGVRREKLYTHVAAAAAVEGPSGLAFTHAPLSVAFNRCARPGFTTYAWGPLASGLDAVVEAVRAAGESAWGSTEASLFVPPNGAIDAETYLRWHFGAGATLLVINSGATGVGARLDAANFSERAVKAYRRFLAGAL